MTRPAPPLRRDVARPARLGADDAAPAPVQPAWVGVEGAATYSGLSETTVRRAAWSGALPASRIGARLVFSIGDIERWLRSARIGGRSGGAA